MLMCANDMCHTYEKYCIYTYVCVYVCVKDSNNNTVDMMMYLLIVYTCIYVHVCVSRTPIILGDIKRGDILWR